MSDVNLEKVVSHYFNFHQSNDSQKEDEEEISESKSKFNSI